MSPSGAAKSERSAGARIGLFGGSFDPVHRGHVRLAESALKELRLDRVFFIPARASPFKGVRPAAGASHRARMLSLALGGKKRLRVSSCDLVRRGPSYSIRTVRSFRRRFPAAELFWILGGDAFREFRRWKEWKRIVEICRLAVAGRPGSGRAVIPGLGGRVVYLKSSMPAISSSRARGAAAGGRGLVRLVPAPVARYITKHALYRQKVLS